MEAEHGFLTATTAVSLFLMAFGALLVPMLCRPLRLPAAVGEIMFGVMVGPYVLGWVEFSDFIHIFSELGFFVLMFIGGMELDFTQIEKGGLKALGRGLFTTTLILCFSFSAVYLLGYNWYVGVVVGAISIGIPLVLFNETGLARHPFGQYLLLAGSVGEFAVILLITAISAYAVSGGVNAQFFLENLKLCGVFLLAYILLVIFRSWVWWKSEAFSRAFSYHDPSEIGVRAGLTLMFSFVAIATTLHIDPILGAFLAGALFSFVFRAKGPLELKFMSIGNGFFIPFFFISVGLGFDLEAASEGNFLLLSKMLLGLFLVRLLAFGLSKPPHHTRWHLLAAAILYSAPLTLLVVIANLGLNLGLVDPTFHSTIILLAVMSSTLYPILFKIVIKKVPGLPTGAPHE